MRKYPLNEVMTSWYNLPMKLHCTDCNEVLLEVPFNNKDKKYVTAIPFCANTGCDRYGLLTVIYKEKDEKGKKGKRKGV